MPSPEEFLRKLAQRQAMEEMMGASSPQAPMGAEPPEFFGNAENAGLGMAPMAPGGTVVGANPNVQVSPAMKIAIAMQQARQAGGR